MPDPVDRCEAFDELMRDYTVQTLNTNVERHPSVPLVLRGCDAFWWLLAG
jgi:hypothetical protein